jgi:serine/threonine-protein kinase
MTDELGRLKTALSARYEIERELGSGGMATVYLARDVKHDRDVAIKVLHPDLGAALGSDRFLSEIKTTAKLQHPHILPLLDSGDAEGLLYYVMPYVTGETLRQRIEREEQLPINAAVSISKEVADALSAAHEMGIVHRDIKPENILLRGNHALVADFGIALAVQHAGGARMTQTGLSLGTPQYMSPEQAMGERNIGPKSDIYSLGAVTYEMLAGEPPFTGHSVQAIVAKVMTERPVPLSTIRNTIPPAVENAVLTALAKLPADRFATASEFSNALSSETTIRSVATPIAHKRTKDPVVIGLGAAVVVLAAIAGLASMKASARSDDFPYRMEISGGERQINGFPTISPDGHTLVFVGRDPQADAPALYVRRLDQLTSQMIPGTARPQGPVFSPDGKWIAYIAGRRKIMKVPVDGGSPVTLGDVPDYGGVSWSKSNEIVLGAGAAELLGGLLKVNADGGSVTSLTQVDTTDKQLSHQQPVVLADGNTVIFTIWYGSMAKAELAATHLDDGKVIKLGVKATQPVGVIDDQLVYSRPDGTLMAVPFDTKRLRTTGNERPVQDLVAILDPSSGTGQAYLSSGGVLVYARRGNGGRLVWVSQKGEVTQAASGTRSYRHIRLSPDGKRAALGIDNGFKVDLWVLDFQSGTLTPLTDDGGARNPVWSSDGKRVYFVSTRGGRAAFWWMNADGSSEPVKLGQSKHNNAWNIDASPDRTTIVFNAIYNGTFNIETYSLDSSHAEREITASPRAAEVNGRFSPDGKWIAYQSDESGSFEIYLRSYPQNSEKIQVSVDGGAKPVWSPDGTKLYYWKDRSMTIATLATNPMRVISRQTLFQGEDFFLLDFDVAPDGKRILMSEGQSSGGGIVVIPNFASEVKAKTH